MLIMYNCDNCGAYCEGMLIQHTNYDNTKNIDDLLLVCEFCGNELGKVFTNREFIGWTKIVDGKKVLTGTTQQDLWAAKRANIEGTKEIKKESPQTEYHCFSCNKKRKAVETKHIPPKFAEVQVDEYQIWLECGHQFSIKTSNTFD